MYSSNKTEGVEPVKQFTPEFMEIPEQVIDAPPVTAAPAYSPGSDLLNTTKTVIPVSVNNVPDVTQFPVSEVINNTPVTPNPAPTKVIQKKVSFIDMIVNRLYNLIYR